jgi:hypothetical protein
MTPKGKPVKKAGPTETVPAVLRAVARVVDGAAPDLHMERKWGAPWRVGNDLVLCYGAFTHHGSSKAPARICGTSRSGPSPKHVRPHSRG